MVGMPHATWVLDSEESWQASVAEHIRSLTTLVSPERLQRARAQLPADLRVEIDVGVAAVTSMIPLLDVRRLTCWVIVLVAFLVLLGCDERPASLYNTFEDAWESSAMKRGWVPDFLPASASTIREIHDVDTNEVWGTFSFRWADADSLRVQLAEMKAGDMTGVEIRVPNRDWWPRSLSGLLASQDLFAWEALLYDPHGQWFLALDQETSSGFFWRLAK